MRRKNTLMPRAREEYLYSEGESGSEFRIRFSDLKPQQKLHRTIFLWKKAYSRTKAAARVFRSFYRIQKKLIVHG